MMEEDGSIELLPLRTVYRKQSSTSIERDSPHLLRQLVASVCFSLVGWYYPRYLISTESSIVSKPVPLQKLSSGDVVLDMTLNHPRPDHEMVPSSVLIWTSLYLPFLLIGVIAYRSVSYRWHDVHAGICGLCCTVGLCEGSTQLLKLFIQRPRPIYYALCAVDLATGKCTGSLDMIREANFSFPSGHSSLAASGMNFLCLFLVSKILSRWGSSARWTCVGVSVVCWGWAIFVAASRLVDHWHHYADVLAGLCLGAITSTFMFHAWYPPVWDAYVGVPWSIRSSMDEDVKAT